MSLTLLPLTGHDHFIGGPAVAATRVPLACFADACWVELVLAVKLDLKLWVLSVRLALLIPTILLVMDFVKIVLLV